MKTILSKDFAEKNEKTSTHIAFKTRSEEYEVFSKCRCQMGDGYTTSLWRQYEISRVSREYMTILVAVAGAIVESKAFY